MTLMNRMIQGIEGGSAGRINYVSTGIGTRAIASIAERHTTVTGTTYANAGGISTVERVPLVCMLSPTKALLVTQGSRDNGSDYHFYQVIGRIVTVLDGTVSVGQPFVMHELAAYTAGAEWLNIGSLSRVPDARGRVHLLFSVFTGTAGVIERAYALHLYSDNASAGTSSTWNSPLRGTYSSGYSGGTDDISASIIKVSNSVPAGQPTCYTAGDNSRDDVWDHYAFGPGNIEKLSDGTLVAFADHRYRVTSATAADKIPYSHSVRSTDNGDTWSLAGGYVENAADANAYTNEICGVVLNASNHLFVNSRITSGSNQNARATATVTDHTANWPTPSITTDLGGNDCAASMCADSVGGTLYTQMVSNTNTDLSTLRCHIGVWKSVNAGVAWTFCKTINHEIGAYSALACLDGSNFVSFFEHNRDVVEVDSFAQDIKAAAFDKTWLNNTSAYSSVIFYFNEATSGAIPTTGRPIRNYGTAVCGGGYGGAGGTYNATGIVADGIDKAAILQTAMKGINSSDSSNMRGGPCDFGVGEAITITIVGLVTTTGENIVAGRTVLSNRNNGLGGGWRIGGGTSGALLFTALDNSGLGTNGLGSPGSRTCSLGGTSTRKTVVFTMTADRSVVAYYRDNGDGVFVAAGTNLDWSAMDKGITGVTDLTFGAGDNSGATVTPAAIECEAIIIEKGIARTSGFTWSGNLVKQTWDAYNGFAGYTPGTNDPATVFANCKSHVLAVADGGYNCRTDLYGYYPGKATRQPGDPVNSYVDRKTSGRLWSLASSSRGLIQVRDAIVGPAFRMQYVSGAGNGYLTCPAHADFNFNTDGIFTLIFPVIQFNTNTGSNQTIWDQCTGSAANSGMHVSRVNSTGAVTALLTKGDTTNVLFTESAFGGGSGFTGLALNTPYFLGFVGAGAGAKVKMYVGPWLTFGVAPILTAYDSGSNLAAVDAGPAACGAPYIGVRNDASTSTLADIELLRDVVIARDTASAAHMNQIAAFAAAGCSA